MRGRPGFLSGMIILTTFLILVAITLIRYRDRPSARSGSDAQKVGGTQRIDMAWQDLPRLKPFELLERSGQPISEGVLENQVALVSFFFSRCPSICKRQNEALQRLQTQFRRQDQDVVLVSVTVDPAHDTPEILRDYALLYNADPSKWLFLTGDMQKIKSLGEDSFGLPIGPETHSTSLMLVDRWGRIRDRFDWEQPSELKKLVEAVDTCLAEEAPPGEQLLKTRMPSESDRASEGHGVGTVEKDETWKNEPWLDEFTLTNLDQRPFGTQQLLGKVWLANSFFTRCPTICKEMMSQVKTLQDSLEDKPVMLVSLTSDPGYDDPPKMKNYAENIGFEEGRWHFLTGDPLHIRRVMSEYFGMFVDLEGPTHDEHLFLIDKWGRIRGKFAYDKPEDIIQLRMEVDRLLAETEKPESSSAP